VERACHTAAGGAQRAPAQRLVDFVARRPSRDLPGCSYLAGLTSVNLAEVLPPFIVDRLISGIRDFERKMPGYLHPDAIVVAPESRTSSPVRMLRNKDTLAMEGVSGLYPCGEGAGYAGGIASAAMDGIRVAEAIAQGTGVNPA
ncbi:MAG: FAD-binding protein, partial [Flavobacteriales bacterium]|nr:FAD-binding protein [Flavobacteriales bacterium]